MSLGGLVAVHQNQQQVNSSKAIDYFISCMDNNQIISHTTCIVAPLLFNQSSSNQTNNIYTDTISKLISIPFHFITHCFIHFIHFNQIKSNQDNPFLFPQLNRITCPQLNAHTPTQAHIACNPHNVHNNNRLQSIPISLSLRCRRCRK